MTKWTRANSKNAESITKWMRANQKVLNQSWNELEQIAKTRRIKNCKNMSKEGLLIALLKSERTLAELHESNSDNAVIGKTRKNFNKLRDKFSRSKIKKKLEENKIENRKEWEFF